MSNLTFNVWRSFVTMATNLPSYFPFEFLEQLVKFPVNFTLLKYVKSQKLWLFNHKRADFWLPNFGFNRSLLSLLNRSFCFDGSDVTSLLSWRTWFSIKSWHLSRTAKEKHLYINNAWKRDVTRNLKGTAALFNKIFKTVEWYFQSAEAVKSCAINWK